MKPMLRILVAILAFSEIAVPAPSETVFLVGSYHDGGSDEPRIVSVSLATRQPSILTRGGELRTQMGLVTDSAGSLIAAQKDRVVRIDPVTGKQTRIGTPTGLSDFADVAVGPSGEIYLIGSFFNGTEDEARVLRVVAESGTSSILTRGGELRTNMGLVADSAGSLIAAQKDRVVRIDPVTGKQTRIGTPAGLSDFADVAVGPSGEIYLIGSFFNGTEDEARVLRVVAESGTSSILTRGDELRTNMGVSIAADGSLFAAQKDRIVRIDPVTGKQSRTANLSQTLLSDFGAITLGPISTLDSMDLEVVFDGVGGKIRLTWTGASGIRLQRATTLVSSVWTDIVGTDGLTVLEIPLTSPSEFFRLAR